MVNRIAANSADEESGPNFIIIEGYIQLNLVRRPNIFLFMEHTEYSKPKRLRMHLSRVAGSGVKPPPFIASGEMEPEEMQTIHALRMDGPSEWSDWFRLLRMHKFIPHGPKRSTTTRISIM